MSPNKSAKLAAKQFAWDKSPGGDDGIVAKEQNGRVMLGWSYVYCESGQRYRGFDVMGEGKS